MLRIATLASGSSGNCAVVSDGRTHILIDAGISARRIVTGLRALGVDPARLAGVLVTHEHSDHIAGLPVLNKQLDFSLCTAAPTGRQLCYRMAGLEARLRPFQPGDRFTLGTLEIGSFPLCHDCACPVGYTVASADGAKLALATDLGTLTQAVRDGVAGARLVVAEANYDLELLRAGRYPLFLKARITGENGHLSNELGGTLALHAVERGARQVILGHLSQENNTPETALRTVSAVLAEGGVRPGRDVLLSAAPRSVCGGWAEV